MGIATNDMCLLCANASETHQHLFLRCYFSIACLMHLKAWLGCNAVIEDMQQLVRYVQNSRRSKFRKQVVLAGVSALIKTRNQVF